MGDTRNTTFHDTDKREKRNTTRQQNQRAHPLSPLIIVPFIVMIHSSRSAKGALQESFRLFADFLTLVQNTKRKSLATFCASHGAYQLSRTSAPPRIRLLFFFSFSQACRRKACSPPREKKRLLHKTERDAAFFPPDDTIVSTESLLGGKKAKWESLQNPVGHIILSTSTSCHDKHRVLLFSTRTPAPRAARSSRRLTHVVPSACNSKRHQIARGGGSDQRTTQADESARGY